MGPYKILNSTFDRGFSVHPFIFIPKWTETQGIENSYEAHERTHCGRQKNFFYGLYWIGHYYVSKSFRFQEETLAYITQVITRLAPITKPSERAFLKTQIISEYAGEMATEYRGMCTVDQAIKALSAGVP